MSRYSDNRQVIENLSGANAETEKIAQSLDDMLSRKSGDGANSMEVDMDMNSYRILNLPTPTLDSEPVTFGYAEANYTGGAEYATAAEESYNATLSLYNDFFDVWKGASATNPEGSFDVGDLYYNTSEELIKVYNGTAWVSAYTVTPGTFTDITTDTLQFTGGTGTRGTMSWNTDEETLDLICDGAVLQIGQEIFVNVRNNTGSTIQNGQTVRYSGTIGASGRPTVELMDASVQGADELYLGIATVDIPNGSDGKICTFGKVRGVNTSAYTEGSVLYTDPSTPGGLTQFKPSTGAKIPAAFVLSSGNNGTLFVQKPKITDINSASDLNISSLFSGCRLQYNGTTWGGVPASRETVYNLTGTDIDPVNGTIQTKTLTANTTFTESLSSGDSVTLMIDDGTGFTVTWPTISWVGGSAPTLETTGDNVIVLWKVGTALYGLFVGAA